MEATLNFKPL